MRGVRRVVLGVLSISIACGARTELRGTDLGANEALDAGDAGDARADAGPPPSPCVANAPIVLASGGKEIQFVALDDANVYFTDFALGTLSVVPKAGGAPNAIVEGLDSPSGLAVQNGTIDFAEFNGDVLASVTTSGGAFTTLASNQDGAYDVTSANGGVYWTTFRGCTVRRISNGGSAELDVANQPFSRIVSGGDFVFWISYEDKSVVRFDVTTSEHATLVSGGNNPPFSIATDGATLYFGETSATQSTVASIPATGGATTTLFSSTCGDATDAGTGLVGSCLASIATDGAWVYFTGEGLVRKVATDGSGLATIAAGQSRPYAIAVDDKCVYWSNLGDGTVWAAPK